MTEPRKLRDVFFRASRPAVTALRSYVEQAAALPEDECLPMPMDALGGDLADASKRYGGGKTRCRFNNDEQRWYLVRRKAAVV